MTRRPIPLAATILTAIVLSFWGSTSAMAEIAISERDCQQLVVKHEPAPDVTYQPGVDVHGNAVALDRHCRHTIATTDLTAYRQCEIARSTAKTRS